MSSVSLSIAVAGLCLTKGETEEEGGDKTQSSPMIAGPPLEFGLGLSGHLHCRWQTVLSWASVGVSLHLSSTAALRVPTLSPAHPVPPQAAGCWSSDMKGS